MLLDLERYRYSDQGPLRLHWYKAGRHHALAKGSESPLAQGWEAPLIQGSESPLIHGWEAEEVGKRLAGDCAMDVVQTLSDGLCSG